MIDHHFCEQGSNQVFRGFDVDVAYKVGQIGGFSVQLVPMSSLAELMQALRDGSIDMMVDVTRATEREASFLYGDCPITTMDVVVYTKGSNANYAYGDFDSLDGARIGVIEGAAAVAKLADYCERAGISPTVVSYKTKAELSAALDSGEVDCCMSMRGIPDDCRPVVAFSPSETYFMFAQGNAALQMKIDEALEQLRVTDPTYIEHSYNQHVKGKESQAVVLTAEESAYLVAHPVLRVALPAEAAPFSSFDANGKPSGITVSYYEEFAKRVGVNVEFIAYPTSADAQKGVLDGEADVLGLYYDDIVTAHQEGMELSDTCVRLDTAMLVRRGYSGSISRVAVTERTADSMRSQFKGEGYDYEFVTCKNMEECYNQLISGKVDAAVGSTVSASWLMNEHSSREFTASTPSNIYLNASSCVKSGNSTLLSILNKGIRATESSVASIVLENNASQNRNIMSVIESVPPELPLSIVCALFALVFSLIVAILLLVRRQKERNALALVQMETRRREAAVEAETRYNEDRNRFFASVSHDMRTPLNAIIGFSELAKKEDVSDRVADYLEKISLSGGVLLELINDTLTITRINDGKARRSFVAVDEAELVNGVAISVREVAAKKDIEFSVKLPEANRTVVVDKLNVQKILLNLLTNAVKYTPEGGHVSLVVTHEEGESGQLETVFVIQDDGIGMSDAFMSRMYDPFAQENRDSKTIQTGTGLGLAIVKSLVALHGGTIDVASKENVGTKFTVRLHFEEADLGEVHHEGPASKNASEGTGTSLADIRVLLCEDNLLNTEIAVALLEERGVRVDVAQNGRVGVEMFEQSSVGTYDIVLMDLRMPEMGGFDATRAIRALERFDAQAVPIVAMTAEAAEEDVEKCFEVGMNGHIAKPINVEEMFNTISSLIG